MSTQESKYKLTYFNIRGIAESIRYLFKLANQDFEDVRIEMGETWPDKKPDYPWGKLPVLEVDGQVISQSAAIGRFLANRFGLAGKNEFESAKCDEYVDALKDLSIEFSKWFGSQDPDAKADLMTQLKELHVPKYLEKFNEIIRKNGESGWLVGQSVTWADLFVASTVSSFGMILGDPDLLIKYPAVNRLVEKVTGLEPIAKWIKERPATAF